MQSNRYAAPLWRPIEWRVAALPATAEVYPRDEITRCADPERSTAQIGNNFAEQHTRVEEVWQEGTWMRLAKQRARRIARWLALGLVWLCLLAQQPGRDSPLALGRSAMADLDWGQALRWFALAATGDTDDPAPLLDAGQIYLWQGRLPEAAAALAVARQRAPNDAAGWEMGGDCAARQGDLTTARVLWQRAMQLSPTSSVGVLAATALTHDALTRADPAAALLIARQVTAPTAELQRLLALAALHLGQVEAPPGLLSDLTKDPLWNLVTTWHGNASDQAALGYLDLTLGYPALAAQTLRAILPALPAYGVGYAYLALAFIQIGDLASARAALGMAQRLAPMAEATVGATALLELRTGLPTVGVALIFNWQASHVPSAALWQLAALAADAADNRAAALDARWNLTLVAATVDQANAWEDLASYYLRTGIALADPRAPAVFARLRVLTPPDAVALDLLAQWEIRNGQADRALIDLRAAIARDPRAAQPHADLGALALRLGDQTTAIRQLNYAADLDPTGNLRAQLRPELAALHAPQI